MYKKIFVLSIGVVILVAVAVVLYDVPMPAKAAQHTLTGYAWSSNIGWIQMDPGFGGVTFNETNGNLSGYAWSSNIGWVSFNSSNVQGCGGCSGAGCQAKVNKNTGDVTGWARAVEPDKNGSSGWDGCIKMNGSDYGLRVNNSPTNGGNFLAGGNYYAWGDDVVGWVSFCGDIYCVGGIPKDYFAGVVTCSLIADKTNGEKPLSVKLTATANGGNPDYMFRFKKFSNSPWPNWSTWSSSNSSSTDYTYNKSGMASAQMKYSTKHNPVIDCNDLPINIFSGTNFFLSADPTSIAATIKGGLDTESTESIIKIIPKEGFTSDVILFCKDNIIGMDDSNDVIPKNKCFFIDPVTNKKENSVKIKSSSYNTGSKLTIGVQGNTHIGFYKVIVGGLEDGAAGNIPETTVEIVLNVTGLDPNWEEI